MYRRKISEVLKVHTDELMALPGVMGVAEGKSQGKPCIKVFLVEMKPELLKQIPDTIEGYPIKIDESGELYKLDS